MSWLLDWMPWWVWPALIGLALLVTMNLWLPVATLIWNRLPVSVRWVLVGVGTAGLAYLAGRNRGRRNALEEQRRREAQAIQKRLEVNRRVDRMTPEEADKEDDRWVRD